MAQTRKNKRTTVRMKRTFTQKKGTAKLSPPVVKAVKNIVNAQSETKFRVGTVVTAGTAFTRGITSVAECYPCMPSVARSTGEANSHTRIGDQISPTSLVIKGRVSFTYNTAVSRNITVHIFVLSAKAVRNWDNYTAIPIGSLLATGNGDDATFNGTITNAALPVQRDTFTVHKYLKFNLTKGYGVTNPAAGNATDSVILAQNSSRAFSISLKPPKVLKYADNAGLYPQNYAPFLCMGWTYNDEPTAGDSPSTLITMNVCQTHLRYKDD